jgi:hypothetical protein
MLDVRPATFDLLGCPLHSDDREAVTGKDFGYPCTHRAKTHHSDGFELS